MTRNPIAQDPRYHEFADRRPIFGIPNILDVVSNIPFLLVGLRGVKLSIGKRFVGAAAAWTVFFMGVAVVGVGSAYYHWQPGNDTLVWDRLPMTVGFMALFVALLDESISDKLGTLLLAPALLVGVSSVVYWHLFDDLRFYAWVQLIPLLTIPIVMALFPSRYSHRWFLLWALGSYLLAKVFEAYDHEIFALTHRAVGGHAVKHLLAATGCFLILQMLRKRRALQPSNGNCPG